MPHPLPDSYGAVVPALAPSHFPPSLPPFLSPILCPFLSSIQPTTNYHGLIFKPSFLLFMLKWVKSWKTPSASTPEHRYPLGARKWLWTCPWVWCCSDNICDARESGFHIKDMTVPGTDRKELTIKQKQTQIEAQTSSGVKTNLDHGAEPLRTQSEHTAVCTSHV